MATTGSICIKDLHMLECLATEFPIFYERVNSGYGEPIDSISPPIAIEEIKRVERNLGIVLPYSYKQFLQCVGGISLLGGAVTVSFPPDVHDFPPFAALTRQQQAQIIGPWPPPSQGLLCFGDFWLRGDGDQVLFDTRQSLINEEYTVLYYDHEARPASIEPIASSFRDWVECLLLENSFNN